MNLQLVYSYILSLSKKQICFTKKQQQQQQKGQNKKFPMARVKPQTSNV